MVRWHSARKAGGGRLVVGVARFRRFDRLPQIADDGGQVGFELLLRLAELLDLRQLVVQEGAYEPVEIAGAGHIDPHGLFPVLKQNGGLRVFKEDVVLGVAPVELVLNLAIQVVVGVFGLPVAPVHTEGVFHRAVGAVVKPGFQLVHQGQLFPVFAAIGVEANGKSAPYALLLVRAAELNKPLLVGVVAFDMRICGHIRNIHYQGGVMPSSGAQGASAIVIP